MSDVGQFIGGVVLTAGGIALSIFSAGTLSNIGMALAFAGASMAVGAFSSAGERQEGITRNIASPRAVLPLVYGKAKVGGRLFEDRVDPNSDDRKDRYRGMAFCLAGEGGHGIEGIEKVWFNELEAITGGVNLDGSTGGVNTGVASAWSGNLRYNFQNGQDGQTVSGLLNNTFSSVWTTSHKGVGVAHMVFKMVWDEEVWSTGAPRVTALIKGAKVWDPRTDEWLWDSADSAVHAASDPNPGENPALMILDYLTSARYGKDANYPERDSDGTTSEIDEQSFIDAANFCDEDVTINIGGSNTTKTRFTAGGFINPNDPVDNNLAALLSACRGRLIYEGGKWRLFIKEGTESASGYKLDESKTIGDWEYTLSGLSDAPNEIYGDYVNAALDYSADEVKWPEAGDTTLLDEDGGFRATERLSFPFTTDEDTAKQLVQVLLREARQNVTLRVTADASATQVSVGELIEVSNESAGWTDKLFWVEAWSFNPDFTVDLLLREFDADVYSLDDQQSPASLPGTDLPDPTSIDPPENLVLTADSTTALDTQDGAKVPRIKVEFDKPSTAEFLSHYELQYKLSSASEWEDQPDIEKDDRPQFIRPVTDGETYDVRVRAVNTINVKSTWLSDSVTVSTQAGKNLSPQFDFETRQVGSQGRLKVIEQDPQNLVQARRWKSHSGADEYDFTDPTDGSWGNISEGVEMSVSLKEKHTSFIAWAAQITQPDGTTEWRVVTVKEFDADTIPHVRHLDAQYDANGQVIVQANIDEDSDGRFWCNVGINSTPSDPGAGAQINVSVLAVDSVSEASGQTAEYGDEVIIKARTTTTIGGSTVLGPVKEVRLTRGDTKRRRPKIRAQAVRTGTTVRFDITVEDLGGTKAVQAIEFKVREGLEGGDTLSSSWLTSWDYSNGSTIGSSTLHTRGEDISVAGGLEGEFLWRVRYLDEEGVEREEGDSIDLSNLEEVTKKVVVDQLKMLPVLPNSDPVRNAVYYRAGVISDTFHRASVLPLPVGVTITNFRARGFADTAQERVDIVLMKVDTTDTASDVSATLQWNGPEGPTWKSDAVSAPVQAEESFQVEVLFNMDIGGSTASADDCRYYRAEVTYTVPAYKYTI